jgi:hypothetical protein
MRVLIRISLGFQGFGARRRRHDRPGTDVHAGEHGMTTAELLGNAALGIAALVAIWAVLQTLGLDVVDWMRGQLRV